MSKRQLNFLCISTFFKGQDFLIGCKAEGHCVHLFTKRHLEHADWPWDAIDQVHYIDEWNDDHVKNGLAYLFRSIHFDRFVALDDFDVEKVASLREHFRMPGMGDTTARFFRDKLAMRVKAQTSGINVPKFTSLFNDEVINNFADQITPPWLIKPRTEASATGIRKIQNKEDLWKAVHELGDGRQNYLAEQFAPGDVYHVDGLNYKGKVVFSRVSKYLDTPLEVAHGGGIFRSQTVDLGSEDDKALQQMNRDVMEAFGMQFGASHTEFIKSKATGEFYFLETSSRVGGANLAEMVETASGVNLWTEWAKIESANLLATSYKLPKAKKNHAGIVVSLSRFEHPDSSGFNDPEVTWRMNKPWHIGLIVESKSRERVLDLLNQYTQRISADFHASLPPSSKTL